MSVRELVVLGIAGQAPTRQGRWVDGDRGPGVPGVVRVPVPLGREAPR